MVTIEAQIQDMDKLNAYFAAAPIQIRRAMTTWMMSEKKKYVGTRGKYGIFKKQLLRLSRSAGAPTPFKRGGKWGANAAGAFSGYFVTDKEGGSNQMTKWGLGLNKVNPFIMGLQKMDVSSPDRTITSGKWMAIPVYKNLQKVGIRPGKTALDQARAQFEMVAIKKGDTLLWFASLGKKREQRGRFNKSQLMFVGKKAIRVKVHFDFERQYKAQEGAAINRLEKIVNRRIRDMEIGKVEIK